MSTLTRHIKVDLNLCLYITMVTGKIVLKNNVACFVRSLWKSSRNQLKWTITVLWLTPKQKKIVFFFDLKFALFAFAWHKKFFMIWLESWADLSAETHTHMKFQKYQSSFFAIFSRDFAKNEKVCLGTTLIFYREKKIENIPLQEKERSEPEEYGLMAILDFFFSKWEFCLK